MVTKIKIFVVSPWSSLFYLKGGGGTPTIYNLIKGFVDAGHEVHMIYPFEKNEVIPLNNLYFHRFKLPFNNFRSNIKTLNRIHSRILYFLFILLATHKALRVARKIGPDIIYGLSSYGAIPAYIVAKVRGVPNITRLYGITTTYSFIHHPFQLLLRFDRTLSFKIPCKYLIITNDGTKGDEVAERLGVPAERIKFWMNGVDDLYIPNFNIEKFKSSLGIPKDKKIVLAVSRLDYIKRVDRLINAIPSITSQFKDVTFLIVGDGPERGYLEKLTIDLNIKHYVKFVGAIPHNEIKRYMNSADIFVSLSGISNVGNSLLEAMSCGRCIVTLNTAATGEIIRNNENGILLEPKGLHNLPNVIIDLLKNERHRKKLGAAAREYATKNFQSWDERIKMEIELIEKIVTS